MSFWLMKSEPSAYAWTQLVKDKKTGWTGVRNHLAARHMKTMNVGDEAFFYHSNEGKEIVGIMKIIKTWHPDPTDTAKKFGMVDVAPVRALKSPVTLADIKAHPVLKNMVFVKQSRLSVSPVTSAEWKLICTLGGL